MILYTDGERFLREASALNCLHVSEVLGFLSLV